MPIVTKYRNGLGYYYFQHTTRVGGKPKTPSKYIGPVSPKRASGRLTLRMMLGQLFKGGADFAAHAAIGKLGRPVYKNDQKPYDRAARVLDDKLRALGEKFQVDVKTVHGHKVAHGPSRGATELYKAEREQLVGKPAPADKPALSPDMERFVAWQQSQKAAQEAKQAKAETVPATADKAPAVEVEVETTAAPDQETEVSEDE